jgi:hypothetical protein
MIRLRLVSGVGLSPRGTGMDANAIDLSILTGPETFM